jgi:hypothetical protein
VHQSYLSLPKDWNLSYNAFRHRLDRSDRMPTSRGSLRTRAYFRRLPYLIRIQSNQQPSALEIFPFAHVRGYERWENCFGVCDGNRVSLWYRDILEVVTDVLCITFSGVGATIGWTFESTFWGLNRVGISETSCKSRWLNNLIFPLFLL